LQLKRTLWLTIGLVFGASLLSASGVVYTCDPSVPAAYCNTLTTTIAGLYDSTFSNANANIYISMGDTSLGESIYVPNSISYASYLHDLTSEATGGVVQTDAIAALNEYDTPALCPQGLASFNCTSNNQVAVTGALGEALGISTSQLRGVEADGSTVCYLSSAGCYSGDIVISDSASLYYRSGSITGGEYDFFTAVEHETDEVLGTASCMNTTAASGLLTDACGGHNESAVDLFRYNSAGKLALNSAYAGLSSAPSGAYFSFNGGVANVATYNTLANGLDYADFTTNCTYVQDAYGCAGMAGLDITNDGPGGTNGPEISILNAVGYDVVVAPEPGTLGLLGAALGALGIYKRRMYRRHRSV